MKDAVQLIRRPADPWGEFKNHYDAQTADGVRRFHASFPEYAPTPLCDLKALAGYLGVERIWVKDESKRFGLNAFKVLGGSYCIGRELQGRFGIASLTYAALTDPALCKELRGMTLVTATDGNHGRGVAWTARRLGLKCVVYMPMNTCRERLENIRALGAQAEILDCNYDAAVRFACAQAERHGWVLVQDTAWEGYERVPMRIMQGYTTIGGEIMEQLGGVVPTHIFLQAGVGAMAGAMTAFFSDALKAAPPRICIVEPLAANCIFRSARANQIQGVGGSLKTIMAGLACGEPCTLAWDAIRRGAEYFASIPDETAALGMRILGNPLDGDPTIISGESGASCLGFVAELQLNPERMPLRQLLGLDGHSRLLFLSTEGDTDRENYRDIVWRGKFPWGQEAL